MPVTGVITAAGRSSRMAPDHKLIMDINGKTLIMRSLESLLPFCSKIIVVIGAYAQEIGTVIKDQADIELVTDPKHKKDMFSSVKTGLKAAEGTTVLLLPGDCPFATHELIERMLNAQGDVIAPAYKGKLGQPLLLSAKSVSEILQDPDLRNLKHYLQNHDPVLINTKTQAILWDIDTPSDLHRARIYFAKIEGE